MKYEVKLDTDLMIGSAKKDQLKREAAVLDLISRLNANPTTKLSQYAAGEMLVNAEKRYQLTLKK